MQQFFNFKNLIDLEKALGTEQECRDQYESVRWDGCAVCPDCGCDKTYILKPSKYNNNYKCAECYKRFNCLTGTIFENTKLELRLWFKALYLLASTKKGLSSPDLAAKLGVTQKTSWFLIHRIREMIRDKEQPILEGEILADETFVGGKNKNRHKDKKVKHSQGRAFIDKTPIVGIMQNEESHIIERPHKVIPNRTVKEKIITSPAYIHTQATKDTSAQTIQPIIFSIVRADSVFISDEWGGYNGLEDHYDHRVIDHSRKEYVGVNGDTTNRLEGAWQKLKGKIVGTHVQVSRKHLQRYSDEFQFHYNYRHLKPQERFMKALFNQPTRLRYKDLIQKGATNV
jgi:transposase-like protein